MKKKDKVKIIIVISMLILFGVLFLINNLGQNKVYSNDNSNIENKVIENEIIVEENMIVNVLPSSFWAFVPIILTSLVVLSIIVNIIDSKMQYTKK
jgi:hypothetical protein